MVEGKDVLKRLEDLLDHGYRVATASEIAEDLDASRRHVLNVLRGLEASGLVESRTVGARAVIWWPSEQIESEAAARAQQPEHVGRDDTITSSTSPEEHDEGARADDVEEHEPRPIPSADDIDVEIDVDEIVTNLDLPGHGTRLDARREAVGDIYRYLIRYERATAQELKKLVDPAAVEYDDHDSFWTNAMRSNQTFDQLPGIERPGRGGHYYRFVGLDDISAE